MEHLLKPISNENPCGEDPRYLEEFSELKSEIEKKADVNYERIETLAYKLLQQHAKDFRLASYWALARTKQMGIAGLFEGLELITQLYSGFSQQLHPQKEKARMSAVQWLQQPKVLSFALAKADNLNAERLAQYSATLESYNSLIAEITGEHAAWPELAKFLKAETGKYKPAEVANPPSAANQNHETMVKQAQSSAAAPAQGMPSSMGQFQQQARLLIRFCKEQKLYGQMIGLTRGLLWAGLSIPANDNKITKVPVFPAGSINRVRALIEQEQFIDAFIASEEGMLAPGGLFCMELQHLSMMAARKSALLKEATLIEIEVVGLYKRLPKLFQLCYDNGDPFASAAVMAWLEQATETNEEGGTDSNSKFSEWQQACTDKVNESGVEVALAYLNQCCAVSEFEQLQLNALRAKTLLDVGQEAIALPIYLQLEADIKRLCLAASQPEFCLTVWRSLHRLLNNSNSGDSAITERNRKLQNEIFDRVCQVDALKAMQWFS